MIVPSTTPQLICELARSQLGVKESAPNDGIPYIRYAMPGEQPLAWCARFCRWVWKEAGVKIPGNQYEIAAVKALVEAMQSKNLWDNTPSLGAIIAYGSRKGSDAGNGKHCGIVVRVGSDTITTIEGNFGDKVAERVVKLSERQILGFGRVPKEVTW